MAFAKEYREEITLAYYCLNFALTIAVFVFGTIYLRHRDRRDQQRKESQDRTDQQRKEWRRFAETVMSEHRKLKAENIPWKISKVKDTFKNIQIYKEITGTDVLRFMVNDPDRDKCFKTTELDAFREDLDSIYQLLNTCASLILLGTVPKNIKSELGELVTKLGQLALPFYKGEERANILKCLDHFRRPDQEEVKWNIDDGITENVRYVRYLRFGGVNQRRSQLSDRERREKYGTCSKLEFKFTFDYSDVNQQSSRTITFLKQLHVDLEQETYTKDFAENLRAKNLKFIDKIDGNDCDKLVKVKVLHEVRHYIHIISEGREALDTKRNQNIDILREVHENVTKIRPDEVIVRDICERFIFDLSFLKETMQPYHKSEYFRLQFQQLYKMYCDSIIIRSNDGPRPRWKSY